MGRSFNSIEHLPAPFDLVDERIVDFPAGSYLMNDSTVSGKLVLCLEGAFRQNIDETWTFDYRTGDAAFFPRPCRQEIYPLHPNSPNTLHALRILFDETWNGGCDSDPEYELSAFVRHHLADPVCVRGYVDADVSEILKRVRHEAEQMEPGFRSAVAGYLQALVVIFVRRMRCGFDGGRKSRALERGEQISRRAEAFIRTHFQRRIGLAEIAWDQNLSAEHLARVFRATTGKTVGRHLEQVRLEHAKNLLIDSRMRVTEIARACGFSSATHLGVRFRSETGTTPTAYRGKRALRQIAEPSRYGAVKRNGV